MAQQTITEQRITRAKNEAGIDFAIATTTAEREAAFRLAYDVYLKVNMCGPNRFGMRITPYHLLPTTEVFTAALDGELVATLTLVRDGELGLPMESIFDDKVVPRRNEGLRLAEVCALASCCEDTRRRFSIYFELCRLMIQFVKHKQVDQVLAPVRSRHAMFYRRYMAFEPIGEPQNYPGAGNIEVQPMCLDMHAIRKHHEHPRFKRFFSSVPDQCLQAQPMSAEQRRYFARMVDPNCRPPLRENHHVTELENLVTALSNEV